MNKYIFIAISLLIGACESKKGPSKEDFTENLDEMSTTVVEVSDENINNILNGMPSPMEISFMLPHLLEVYGKQSMVVPTGPI